MAVLIAGSRLRSIGAILLLATALTGCSHGGVQDETGHPVQDVYAAFTKGEVRLRCNTSCSGAWGAESRNWSALYKNALWRDLALRVSEVNFQGDLHYYYLGRAAESLGYPQAASTYYRLSRATQYKCSGNLCDGINVPEEVAQGLVRVTPLVASPTQATDKVPPVAESASAPTTAVPETKPAAATSKNGTGTVTATFDEFTKSTSYSSDLYRHLTVTGGDTSETIVGLAATANPTITEYFIVVNHTYEDTDSHLYSLARDSSGEQLQYTRIKTNVSSCSHSICLYSEIGTMKVDRGYLDRKSVV